MKFPVLIAAICVVCACHTNDNAADTKTDAAKKAITSFTEEMQQQLQQFPDSTGLRLQYAFMLDSASQYKEALAQIDTLLQKDSLNERFLFARGQVAENAQDTMLALKSYAAAAAVYESPDALLALANLYAEQKNDRAILLCSRVMAQRPDRAYAAHAAFITGIYYARSGKGNEAVQYFDECIAINYTYMEAYIEKGLVYFDRQQYQKALQVFQFASTVNNLYADAYYYQARCYEMMNKKDSAVLRFKQSLQLDPTMEAAKEHLNTLNK